MPPRTNTGAGRRPRRRRWLARACALLAGLAVAFGLAEGYVRWRGLHVARMEGKSVPVIERVPDPVVGFRLIPGLPVQRYREADGSERQVLYRINRMGFRGRPVFESKPDGVFRIAVVGDSFVFGVGVGEEHTLPRLVERLFEREPLPGARVQALNFGVPGYAIDQDLRRLQDDALRFEPDLVLLTLYINDAYAMGAVADPDEEDAASSKLRTPQLEWIDRLGLTGNLRTFPEHSSTAQKWMVAVRKRSRLVDLLADRLFMRLFTEHTLHVHEHRWREDGPGWNRVREVLAELRELSEREGFELHVAFYPLLANLDDYPFHEIHARVRAVCDELGFPFHDLLVPLEGLQASSLWAHEQDHHPNALCNAKVSQWLVPRLRAAITAGADALPDD